MHQSQNSLVKGEPPRWCNWRVAAVCMASPSRGTRRWLRLLAAGAQVQWDTSEDHGSPKHAFGVNRTSPCWCGSPAFGYPDPLQRFEAPTSNLGLAVLGSEMLPQQVGYVFPSPEDYKVTCATSSSGLRRA